MPHPRLLLVLVLTIGTLVSCSKPSPPPRPAAGVPRQRGSSVPASVDQYQSVLRFANATDASGIDYQYTNGEELGNAALPELLGGGVALFDYDLDGQLDLFFPGGGYHDADGTLHPAESALYRTRMRQRRESVAALAGVSRQPGISQGAFSVDLDEDGFPDLLVSGWGGFSYWHNQGDGTFIEMTASAGLEDNTWTTGVAWGDVNGDGWLDLYVTRFLDWNWNQHRTRATADATLHEYAAINDFRSLADRLLLSNGDGTWQVVENWPAHEDGAGIGAIMFDADQDGDLDIFVSNYGSHNLFYRNDQKQGWAEIAESSGTAGDRDGQANHGTGLHVGDADGDGYADIWVATGENEVPALYRNVTRELYFHKSHQTAIPASTLAYAGWGTSFADFDSDQDLDLIVACGSPKRFSGSTPSRSQPLVVFELGDDRRYHIVGPQMGSFFRSPHTARGLAVGDLDNDGDLDLVLSLLGESASVLENYTQSDHHWLQLRLVGTSRSRTPVGARIEVATDDRDQVISLHGGGGYLSTNDASLTIGLGNNSIAQSLKIHWPGGQMQTLTNVVANRRLTILEPPAKAIVQPVDELSAHQIER